MSLIATTIFLSAPAMSLKFRICVPKRLFKSMCFIATSIFLTLVLEGIWGGSIPTFPHFLFLPPNPDPGEL